MHFRTSNEPVKSICASSQFTHYFNLHMYKSKHYKILKIPNFLWNYLLVYTKN